MEIINTVFRKAGFSSSLKTAIVSKRIRRLDKPHHPFPYLQFGKIAERWRTKSVCNLPSCFVIWLNWSSRYSNITSDNEYQSYAKAPIVWLSVAPELKSMSYKLTILGATGITVVLIIPP